MGLWDRIKENNKNAFRDNMAGTWRSIKNGTAGDLAATQAEVKAAKQERLAQEMGVKATDATLGKVYREAKAQRGRDVQFESDGIKVLVKSGYSRKFDRYTTDIILIDPGRRGEHLHYVLDENGNEIHKEWTRNHS